MIRYIPWFVVALAALGCGAPQEAELGVLSLALDAHAGGVDYRLIDARFALTGPENKTFLAEDDDPLVLELSPGNYTLSLLDEWTLTRLDDAGPWAVKARLVSQNPIPVVITAGQTTTATLRFELEGGEPVPMGPGALDVDLEVLESGATSQGDCTAALRISELDYEQAGSDEGEFVEVLNGGPCTAKLADVALELVNGGDGKVYARYELAEGVAELPAQARFVLGDPALLEQILANTPRLALRGSGLQNGPDAVRLVRGKDVLDAVAYGGVVSSAGEGAPAPKDDGEKALARCPDGFDSEANASDFALVTPTPGLANQCG